MALSLKDLYYHPAILDGDEQSEEKWKEGDMEYSLKMSFSSGFGSLPKNYFDWPEAKIVANYWTPECTDIVRKNEAELGKEAWRSFKMKDAIGQEAYKALLAQLKEYKSRYEPEGLWIHGYSTPPLYFAEALFPILAANTKLEYEDPKPMSDIEMPKANLPSAVPPQTRAINEPINKGQGLSGIKFCILCGVAGASEIEEKGFLGLTRHKVIACTECGGRLRFIDSERYKLTKITDASKPIWAEYGKQTLTAREWVNIGNGGMSDEKQREADIRSWISEVSAGRTKITFRGIDPPVILKQGEELLCTLPNILLKEPRAVRKSSGGYAGPRIRVSKNISFSLGRFGSTSESHQEIRDIDRGILTITNERFLFSGSMKTISLDLRKIVQIDPFSDAIGLHKDGRDKTQYFVWQGSMATVTFSKGERSYAEPMNGQIIKAMIEGAIANY